MKKGFTLVELLAVIAILAVLAIITLPNVISIFNDAKKSSFENEVKTIYKQAQTDWLVDSMSGSSGEQVYTRCNNCTGKQLKLSGRSNIDYYVKVNSGGSVVEFYVTDGDYQFQYEGDLLATFIQNIEEVNNIEESDVFTIESDEVKSNSIGLPGVNILLNCSPGSYRGGTGCLPCPANTYSVGFNALSCTRCPEGTCTEPGVTGASMATQCSRSCSQTPNNPGGSVDR